MVLAKKILFLPLRSLAFGSISGTYAAVGNPLEQPVRMFRLINATNGDLIATTKLTEDQFFISASSFVLYDLTANSGSPGQSLLAEGTQFYVKQSTAPSSKSFYIELVS
jgi:hypothetical protein